MKSLLSGGNKTYIMLYLFSFFLIWEWLRPIQLLTDTANISFFLYFIGLSLLLSFLKVRFLPNCIIKITYIIFALYFLYFENSIIEVIYIFQDIAINIGIVLDADWNNLTNNFRSFLFFLLLWLITYLIRYWLVARKRIFLFFSMTFIYITILDTFTEYEADGAIIRIFVTGFTMMGLLSYERLVEQNRMLKNFSLLRQWMVPLTCIIIFCVTVGWILPKPKPIWPDPVPYIKSFNKKSGNHAVQTIGYGTDDSNLGGPFINDKSVVMRVESDDKHYWKIESKDIYTGKGWTVSDEWTGMIPFNKFEPVPIFPIQDGVQVKDQTSTVTSVHHGHSFIAYPFGVTSITSESDVSFQVDRFTDKISSFNYDGINVSINEYTVSFNQPQYSMKELKTTQLEGFKETEYYRIYTQTPWGLPERIKELTLEITANKKSWYEKAKAVEDYFKGANFLYDQMNVPIPEQEQDYVDQFLFETQRGYCNNFSTSMAVMLRTIGIPTKWVKGFTGGIYKGPGDNARSMYEITNNNAHSWVEVYIPSVGWIPFEPTPGFQNNAQVINDVSDKERVEEIKRNKENVENKTDDKLDKDLDETNRFSLSTIWQASKDIVTENYKILVTIIVVVGFITYLLYKIRNKWLPQILIIKFKGKNKDEDFEKAYLALLKQLERCEIKREKGQTLRDYAKLVDEYYLSSDMGKLTAQYEQYLYKGKLEEGTWIESKELWENLINKTKG